MVDLLISTYFSNILEIYSFKICYKRSDFKNQSQFSIIIQHTHPNLFRMCVNYFFVVDAFDKNLYSKKNLYLKSRRISHFISQKHASACNCFGVNIRHLPEKIHTIQHYRRKKLISYLCNGPTTLISWWNVFYASPATILHLQTLAAP